MAVITFTEDWTTISACESMTNFSAWGADKVSNWGAESDGALEGTYFIANTPKSTGDSGLGYTAVGGISLSTNLLGVWTFLVPGFLGLYANYGLYIRVSSSTTSWTADYNDYKIGGNDVAWCEKGWRFIVLDCNRTADRSAGTCNLSSIQRIGIGRVLLTTASKVPAIGFDMWQYGTKLEVTGPRSFDGTNGLSFNDNGASADTITRAAGDFTTDGIESGDTIKVTGTTSNDGEYDVVTSASSTLTLTSGDLAATETSVTAAKVYAAVGFQDIIDKDITDGSYFGVVTKSPHGIYEVNYNLILGDESGASSLWFVSRGESVVFSDQPLRDVNNIQQALTTAEDTGETLLDIGYSTGTGDDRVGFGGTYIFGDTYYDHGCQVDIDAAITECNVFGSTFKGINGGVAFAADTSHLITNVTFEGCGQITLGSGEARNLVFSGYDGASDAALLWNASIDIENSRFLANRNDTANSAAIEHATAGTFNYVGMQFAANDYDINFSAASGNLIINADSASNPSTSEVGGTGTATIIQTVTVELLVSDTNGDPVELAQVYVQKATPTEYTSGAGNTAGDADLVVTQAITADTPSTGWVLVTDVSLNQILPYRYASWATSTFTFPTEVTNSCTGGGTGTSLQDSVNDFTALDIEEGDTVRNTTDGSWAVVDQIVDASNITTSPLTGGTDNTWTSGDTYSFHKLATTLVSATDLVDVPIMNEQTDALGEASISFPYQSTEVDVVVQVRKSSSGDTRYVPYEATGKITANGFSGTARLTVNPNV